jgi:hypothetical protein
MKNLVLLSLVIFVFISCDSTKKKTPNTTDDQIKLHQVTVREVIQTTKYTYLRVAEDQKDYWTAISKQDFNEGEKFFFMDDVITRMVNFHSQELNRDFPSILFISEISKDENKSTLKKPTMLQKPAKMEMQKMNPETHTGRILPEKANVSVEPVKGGFSIAELYAHKTTYSGKKVKIRGQVVKVNNQIMGRNWVHLQDGTNHGDEYDLTCTTQATVSPDDIITLEGIISLNKDFTAGYFYPVIMEESKLVE